jgi:uncharacterized membrane protein YbhN (UPF0104 family)
VRAIVIRICVLALAGLSLYLLAPKVLEVFSSWPELRAIDPWWLIPAVVFEACSYISLWTLQRIAFRTRSWFIVGTSQLAAGAAGSVIPGGGAAATAVQYGILTRAGIPRSRIGPGLAASWAATTATALALPVVATLALIGGTATPRGLRQVAYLGGGAFVVVALIAGAVLAWDWPLEWLARMAKRVAGWIGKGDRFQDLSADLLARRDGVKAAFASRPVIAILAAVGKWGFDYLALICVLAALDTRPDPGLVLIAYAAASILGMIPLTPGGLGFVEAGLAGFLRLAGVPVGSAAVATLAYRLIGYWLPLPIGGVAYLLARRRYGPVDPSPSTTSASTSDAISTPP